VGLSITVLGCTGSYPGPGEACSGYLVQGGGANVMIDAGPGTVANLQRHLALGELDAVVLSHSHADHWTDFMVLKTALKYGLDLEGLAVFGTAETLAMVVAAAHSDLAPTIDWQVVSDGDTAQVADLAFQFSGTDHYVETLAVRAESGGASFAYSADTGPAWTFEAFGRPVDLAVCEATYETDAEAHGVLHLSASQAGRMARQVGIDDLVLTHLQTGADAAAYRQRAEDELGAPVAVAEVGARFETRG
jgi:ribonuclease BN (tRNA processing enzyme)